MTRKILKMFSLGYLDNMFDFELYLKLLQKWLLFQYTNDKYVGIIEKGILKGRPLPKDMLERYRKNPNNLMTSVYRTNDIHLKLIEYKDDDYNKEVMLIADLRKRIVTISVFDYKNNTMLNEIISWDIYTKILLDKYNHLYGYNINDFKIYNRFYDHIGFIEMLSRWYSPHISVYIDRKLNLNLGEVLINSYVFGISEFRDELTTVVLEDYSNDKPEEYRKDPSSFIINSDDEWVEDIQGHLFKVIDRKKPHFKSLFNYFEKDGVILIRNKNNFVWD